MSGVKETIDRKLVSGKEVSPEMIRQWLDRDINGLMSLLYVISKSQKIKDVIVTELYEDNVAAKVSQEGGQDVRE